MPIGNVLADGILNDIFRTTGYTPPGTGYIALFPVDPGRVYNAANELPATGGYARVAVTKGDAAWSAPATVGDKREITNAAVVNFGTASGAWNAGGPIGYWAYMDSATVGTGNILGSGAVDAPKIVGAGDPVSFPIGTMRIRF